MRLRSGLFAFVLLAWAWIAPPALAAAPCSLKQIAQIPVTMAGLRPLVSVKINGHDAKLVADTGSFFSMLGPGSAASFGLKPEPPPMGIRVEGIGGDADVGFTTAKDFEIVGAMFHDADFFVGEHGFEADGLLGSNFLTIADVEFDFANGIIRFFREEHCDGASLAYWQPAGGAFGVMDITHLNGANPGQPAQSSIIGSATLNGAHLRLEFDTGSPRTILTLRGARRAGVTTTGPDVLDAGTISGVGRKLVPSWIAPFQTFDMGGEQVKTTHLRVADMPLEDVDMLVGADFFLSHRIFVSRTQSKLFFTYNGGPVFDLGVAVPGSAQTAAPQPPAAVPSGLNGDQPTDAAGFTRRGEGFLARHLYEQAIADFTQAIQLEPNDPHHYVDRAAARVENRQIFMAMDDLNQALKLKPDTVPALMLRGQLRLVTKDPAAARADFTAALAADPGVQLRVANAYVNAGLFEDALTSYDAWIAAHPKAGEDLAAPLAGRCRARAFLNRDLDKAAADCSQALKLVPGLPAALDSRALAELRLGQPDKAIADFDQSLKVEPRNAWALYGRGLAKLKQGDKAGADADLAAATALQPSLPQQAKNVGLTS
jgi:tetratricopeptide (TPR) repeat protein